MHELSIATALLAQVRQHTPPGHTPTLVRIEAGPLQSIDPEALTFAWQSLTANTPLAAAHLQITTLPWSLTCITCGHHFISADLYAPCPNNHPDTVPEGSAELKLISIEVETPESAAT